jgi:hypothetical protein
MAAPKPALWKQILLWVVAFLLMAAAAVYQRATGPTHPKQVRFTVAGVQHKARLIRSDWSERTNDAARVVIPDPGAGLARAALSWRRFKMDEPFTEVPLAAEREKDGRPVLVGRLPAQPTAGKLEYYLSLSPADGGELRLPPSQDGNVVIRFKDHVPAWILIPHIFMMFFAVLFGMRAGLAALILPYGMRVFSWVALIGMTVGGMVLGPIVQKFAFGEYWTGFPWGGDWTDNKMMVMWLSWVFACGIAGLKARRREGISRGAVVLGALVMSAVYLIPHSMGGSELDYKKVEQGVDPHEAIKTGQ